MSGNNEVSELISAYWKWMKDKTILKTVDDGWVEVNTPFFDRHNDGLQIYVKKTGDSVEVTDDGYTLVDLEHSGCSLSGDKQKPLLNRILNSNGVTRDGDALCMKVEASEFPSRKNDFITAMQQIGDLYTTSGSNVYTLFSEEVASWLKEHERFSNRDVKLQGSAGVSYQIDFLFPPKREIPEKALQALKNPTKELFAWAILMNDDLKKTRGTEMHVMLNDEKVGKKPLNDIMKLSKEYGMNTHLWSDRQSVVESI
jgi:hypothetical protein